MDKELKRITKTVKNKKEYKIYLLAPKFIMNYMNKLKIIYNKEKVEEKLTYFWIALKSIDIEMEKNNYKGEKYIDILLGKKVYVKSFGILITKKLSEYIKAKKTKKEFIKLYKTVLKEKNSKNIKELIKLRRKTGDCLAICIKELIKKEILKKSKENVKLDEFLHESMKMTQLMDSYVDLYDDYKKGELKFKPTSKDKKELKKELLKDTSRNTIKYPLTGLMLIFGIKYLKKTSKNLFPN